MQQKIEKKERKLFVKTAIYSTLSQKEKKVGKTYRKIQQQKINKIEKQGKFVLLVKKRKLDLKIRKKEKNTQLCTKSYVQSC